MPDEIELVGRIDVGQLNASASGRQVDEVAGGIGKGIGSIIERQIAGDGQGAARRNADRGVLQGHAAVDVGAWGTGPPREQRPGGDKQRRARTAVGRRVQHGAGGDRDVARSEVAGAVCEGQRAGADRGQAAVGIGACQANQARGRLVERGAGAGEDRRHGAALHAKVVAVRLPMPPWLLVMSPDVSVAVPAVAGKP